VDDSEDAAIMLRGTPMRKWGKGRGFVWAQVTSCTVFSCYISPNITTGEYERHLDDLASCVRTQGGPVMVAGDFNAKAFMWGSAVEDAKGGMLANWAAAMNLVAMNRGEPTFERGGSRSVLDVTFCSPDIARRIQGWHVMEAGMTTSDHLPIEFTIRASHSLPEVGRPARGWRWTDSKKDELAALLRRELEHLSSARLSLRSLIFCIFYKIY
jgi:endonuclease/exonuclease/phosphatase family metal-dependent hydrolase